MWQQLRDHGFSRRDTLPGINPRLLTYLIPIFARLPYVIPVKLSDSCEKFANASATGLQVLPRASAREEQVAQLELFGTA
jgi:hypothetical protein